MVGGYAKVVNNFFKLRSFSPPADLSDPNNMMAILLNNMLREEDIARQRAPLANKIFAELHPTAIASKCKDSVSDLLFDVVAHGCYIGPRLSKYAQTTQDKVDHHTYPSDKMVIKAFIANDFVFYNEKKHVIKDSNEDSLQRARFVKITWHIQKTARTANQLPLRQRLINPKFALCAAQCNWYYKPNGRISRMTCPSWYVRQKRVR
jgi:hypothetical protein